MNFIDQRKQLDELHGDLNDKRVKGEDVNPTGKDNFLKRAVRTIRKTLAAENKAGKIGSIVKNIITPFIPSWITRYSDRIGDSLKTKTMIKSENPKTTLAGIVLIVAGIAQLFGLDSLSWDFASIIETALPLLTGVGLLAAKDGSND